MPRLNMDKYVFLTIFHYRRFQLRGLSAVQPYLYKKLLLWGTVKSRYFFLRFKRATEVDFCGERLSLNGRNGFKKYSLKPDNLAANDLGGILVWWLGMCLI